MIVGKYIYTNKSLKSHAYINSNILYMWCLAVCHQIIMVISGRVCNKFLYSSFFLVNFNNISNRIMMGS